MQDFDRRLVRDGWWWWCERKKIEGRKTVPRGLGRFWDGRNVKAEEEREGGVR